MLHKHPHLIEINAFPFLRRMSKKYGKPLTLDSIPEKEWKELASQGFDFVWMMGVWKRSPAARQKALSYPSFLAEYRTELPDFQEADVIGSPYAVYGYEIDPGLGSTACLSKLRETLQHSGMDLILDYVPNHLAVDHPWTLEYPECFVEVSQEVSLKNPGLFFKSSKQRFLAHGRDPHFPSWTDTAQINYFSPRAREAAVEALLKIARVAGGARCDMAMLGLSSVFEKTWGSFLENTPKPPTEFWAEVMSRVRVQYPEFIFIAEVYWDLEWEMQQLGFRFTYDKKLYDRLLHAAPAGIRGHLNAEQSFQEHSLRFIENHDEPRALRAFGAEKSYAAAVIMSTVPGMRFFQEGQMRGAQQKTPVQLGRASQEKENPESVHFYEKLFAFTRHIVLHEGQWEINRAFSCGEVLLSWSWRLGKEQRLIVVNYSAEPAQGRVFFQSGGVPGGVVRLKDALTGEIYERDAGEIKNQGLYVDLGPWKAHLFEVEI